MDHPPSLTASPPEIIRWCVKKIRPTPFFTSRLGLPQTKHDERSPSQIQFFGDAASHCKALYSEWLLTRKDVLDAHFKWKDDLREKAISEYKTLSSQYITPLLDKHGPDLWPDTRDVHNRQTISPEYPRRLMYTRGADRRMLTLYLYCWMMCSLVPKLSAHPDSKFGKQRKEPWFTTGPGYRRCPNDEGAETTEASSHATVSSASILEHGDDSAYERSENNTLMPQSACMPSIPVAQMLPMGGVEEGNTQSPTNCAATEAPHDDRGHDTDANTDTASSEGDEYQPPTTSERRIKRRGYSTCLASTVQNKRQKHSRHGATRSSMTMEARTKPSPSRGYNEEVEGDDATSYPSPPDIGEHTITGDADNLLNFPNVHGSVTTVYEQQRAPGRVTETSNITLLASETVRRGPSSSSTDTNNASVEQPPVEVPGTISPDEDVDPITGEVEIPDLPVGPIERPPSTSAQPSVVVSLKLPASCPNTELLRKKLALRIHDVEGTGLSNPNILVLESTIELLETLSKASHLRLREVYNETFNHHREALKLWLQLLKDIIFFYEITGFRGALSDRDAFLATMPGGCPAAVRGTLLHGRVRRHEWMQDCGIDSTTFAQEVASLFFHLGSWLACMNQASVEDMIAPFTQDLLAWYD